MYRCEHLIENGGSRQVPAVGTQKGVMDLQTCLRGPAVTINSSDDYCVSVTVPLCCILKRQTKCFLDLHLLCGHSTTPTRPGLS